MTGKTYRCTGCGAYLDEKDVGAGGVGHVVTRYVDGVSEPELCGPCVEQEPEAEIPRPKVPADLREWQVYRGTLGDESFVLLIPATGGLRVWLSVTPIEAALSVENPGGYIPAEVVLRNDDMNRIALGEQCLRAAVAAGIVETDAALEARVDGRGPASRT